MKRKEPIAIIAALMMGLLVYVSPAALQAADSIPVISKRLVSGLPTESPLAIGDVNGDGKDELITADTGPSGGVAVRSLDNPTKALVIKGLNLVNTMALSDLDNDGSKEIIAGEWDFEYYPDEHKTVHIYKWNGKGFLRIMGLNRIGTISKIFSLGRPGKEKAGIMAMNIHGCWFTLVSFNKKPVVLWRKKIPGPVIYAGEYNGKTTIICMREKRFVQSPLSGVIMGYSYAGLHQYCTNPKAFTVDQDGLTEIRGFRLPYHGPIWALQFGAFRQKGRSEMVIGGEKNGVPILKVFELQGDRWEELASIDPELDSNVVLGLVKTPSYFAKGLEQLITTSGYAIFYDGNVFVKRRLDFSGWNHLINLAATKQGDLFVTKLSNQRKNEDDIKADLHLINVK